MKNAYLVLTDLHYAARKEHRNNYIQEVLYIIEQVLGKAEGYKQRGYNVHLLMLGDVIDSSMNNPDEAMRCIDLFQFFCSQFTGVYTVLGNHEEHNVQANPFWYLVSELEDESLLKVAKVLQPQSISPCIRVPSVLVDGEVTFYFNHFDTPAKVPEYCKVPIGLFHQNVGSNDICKMWGTFDDVEEASYVRGYRYCYFGHMHLAEGKYFLSEDDSCCGEWLGTCVGTNVVEAETLKPTFNLPAVLVHEGMLHCVEDNSIQRVPAAEAINYTKLELTRKNNLAVAEIRNAVFSAEFTGNLYERVTKAATAAQLDILVDLLTKSYDQIKYAYNTGMNSVISGEEDGDNDGRE